MPFQAKVPFAKIFKTCVFQSSFHQDIQDDPLNNCLIHVFVSKEVGFFSVQLALIKRFEKSSKFKTFKTHASTHTITSRHPQDFSANLLIILMQQFHALVHPLPKDILQFFLIGFLHLKRTEMNITIYIEHC